MSRAREPDYCLLDLLRFLHHLHITACFICAPDLQIAEQAQLAISY